MKDRFVLLSVSRPKETEGHVWSFLLNDVQYVVASLAVGGSYLNTERSETYSAWSCRCTHTNTIRLAARIDELVGKYDFRGQFVMNDTEVRDEPKTW